MGKINFVITGDIFFKLIKKKLKLKMEIVMKFILEDGDEIDIISTKNLFMDI
jgi:hypothetical protein